MDLSTLKFGDFKLQKFYVSNHIPHQAVSEYTTTPGRLTWERFFYVETGCLDFVQNDKHLFCAKEGDIVFVPYDCNYRFVNHFPGTVVNAYIIGFLLYSYTNEPIFLGKELELFESKSNTLYRQLVEEIIQTNSTLEVGFKLKSQAKFLELLHHLLLQQANIGKNPEIAHVLSHIQANYTKNIDINKLIKMSHVSPSTFRRRFLSHTGMSPVAYIHLLKMQKAYNLLIATDLSMTEIAEDINVTDSAYFCKMFKKMYGVSPKMVRKNGTAM